MSSIYAVWTRDSTRDSSSLLAEMMASDARSTTVRPSAVADQPVSLGSSLTGVLPEDRFDRQPLRSADCSLCLIADVRLDNRSELTATLGLGDASEWADSAILLRAWQRWGLSSIDHILGGFAFVIWNPVRCELFAVRDHGGEKSLFFVDTPDLFAVATLPGALLALPAVTGAFDERAVIDQMVLAPVAPTSSFFADIKRLPPGHMLQVTREWTRLERYWHPCDAPPVRLRRDEDYAAGLLEVLDRAMAGRLRRTGGIGSQLSSGLDSSSVTTSAALLLAARGETLTAFTSVPRRGFSGVAPLGRMPDEGPGAADVTALYPNVEHVRLDTEGLNLLDTVRRWTDASWQPISNGVNMLWLERIQHAARERGINVMLTGQGGNATISQFGFEAFATWLRQGRWLRLIQSASRMRQKGFLSWHRTVEEATKGLLPNWLMYRLQRDAKNHDFLYSIAHPDVLADPAVRERVMHDFYGSYDLRTDRAKFFDRTDPGAWNAVEMQMCDIEYRDPTMDKRVYEFCFGIPVEQYVAGDQPRSLVRRAMRRRLPPQTLTRTLRGIQGADWFMSIRETLPQLREELPRLRQSPTAERLVDFGRMEQALSSFPESGYDDWSIAFTYGDAICRGFAYGYFLGKDHAAEAKTRSHTAQRAGWTLPARPYGTI